MRDISLVSDAAHRALPAPAKVSKFPEDLGNRALEYSGMYEDGWMSEHVSLGLAATTAENTVEIRGMIPLLDNPAYTSQLRVLVDGQEVGTAEIKPGGFVLRVEAKLKLGRHRIELIFSKFQRLPCADGRPVAAKLISAGFIQ